MPQWLLTMLIQIGGFIVNKFGIPYLEKNYPSLAPLLDQILAVFKIPKPVAVPESLQRATEAFHQCLGSQCPPHLMDS